MNHVGHPFHLGTLRCVRPAVVLVVLIDRRV